MLQHQQVSLHSFHNFTNFNFISKSASIAALNTTVQSTIDDLSMLLQTMQNYASNQATVPTAVTDSINNIQSLIAQSQNLSSSLGTNDLASDIAAVTALQTQVSQSATGWAAYIADILSASTTTREFLNVLNFFDF
jgi:hypothetical protein